MSFIFESIPGEITLMFISYVLFCSVLMFLFIKTDRDWGRLEVSLDDLAQQPDTPAAVLFSGVNRAPEQMLSDISLRQSLRHCAAHQSGCSCCLHGQAQARS